MTEDFRSIKRMLSPSLKNQKVPNSSKKVTTENALKIITSTMRAEQHQKEKQIDSLVTEIKAV